MFACCCSDASPKQDEVALQTFPVAEERDEYLEADVWVYDDGNAAYFFDAPPCELDLREERSDSKDAAAGPVAPPSLKVPGLPVKERSQPEVVAQESPELVPEPVGAEVRPFVATITKPGLNSAVGWHLDVLDIRYLFICRLVNTGNTPVENYNNSQPAQLQIRNGDYIKAVNGESNNAESMSEAMKKSATLDITIVRPFTFTQTISKNGLSLGLDLKYGPGGASLLVEGVREGVVQKIAADVRGGDRIISVNGVVGTPYVLMQCIQENQHLELGMSRPSS
mmetsp:Transcript_86138/g.278278  ORF Transcript_86138/g.278278 Transcript_86138/m.278278 type:complete len:281 (-) Transcript_86138:76-918(-)